MKRLILGLLAVSLLWALVAVPIANGQVQSTLSAYKSGWMSNATTAKVETLLVIQNTTADTTIVLDATGFSKLVIEGRCGQAQDNDSIAVIVRFQGNLFTNAATSVYWVVIDSLNAGASITDSTAVIKQIATTKVPIKYFRAILTGTAANKKVTGTRVYMRYMFQN